MRKFLSKFYSFFESRSSYIVLSFFILYLLVGLLIFKDYGISWDETHTRSVGVASLNYAFLGIPIPGEQKSSGPIFEMVLVFLEKFLPHPVDVRSIILLRHLLTFLFFYMAVYFFYRLCKNRFGNWKPALLGCLFLILSPRIFADSFYNSKDLAFLSAMIISMYTLQQILTKRTMFLAVVHAFTSAIAIDIRIVGCLFPAFTLLLFVPTERKEWLKSLKILALYVICLAEFTFLFWPVLWTDPFGEFIRAFLIAKKFSWSQTVLYLGQFFPSSNLPWHYIPVWIIITTPLTYCACFFIGFYVIVRSFFRSPVAFFRTRQDDLITLMWFLLPLILVVALKAIVYDGWRHLFFIYPAFVLIGLHGLISLVGYLKRFAPGRQVIFLRLALVAIISFDLIGVIIFMIKNHPHENVYFNSLVGKDFKKIRTQFELDYWGLSYRQGLEWILKNDKNRQINVYGEEEGPGHLHRMMLPESERDRLIFVKDKAAAKYFLTVFRWDKEEPRGEKEVYSININGTKIMAVYQLK